MFRLISLFSIKKNNLTFTTTNKLKYYYEPKSNTKEDAVKWSPKSVVPSSLDLKRLFYSINSDSLNERFNYPIKKEDGIYRIISLGDSFTFGVFVNTKDNWSERLEDKLNTLICKKIKKYEIINLAVPGYDIEYSVERLKLRGLKYNPDLVLFFLKKDDFTQIREIFWPELNSFEKKFDLNNLNDANKKVIFNKEWVNILNNFTIKKLGEKKVLEMQSGYLKNIRNNYHNSLLMFTFPFTEKQYKSIIKKFSDEDAKLFFYDGLTNLYNNKNFYLPDGHPSKSGHEQISLDLFDYLTKNKIIPCN